MRVLVVEDDGPIADAVLHALRREGMEADVAATVAAARACVSSYDVAILDLGLPDGSGFSLIPLARRSIVLTSRDEDVECVAALEAGADDFVGKPFSPRALVARVRAVTRRDHPQSEGARLSERARGLTIDGERRSARWFDRELQLTRTEFDLLAVLAEAPGRVRTRDQLVSRVWGDDYALAERTVDSHLKGLRKKLGEVGAEGLIETVRGVGFTLRETR